MPSAMSRRLFVATTLGQAGVFVTLPRLMADQASSPFYVQGVSNAESAAIKKLLLDFMHEYQVPGLSLAMSYRGELKLVACAGFADRDRQEEVRPTHLFRIASVSKPITSVAILKLAEQGVLDLDERVFGAGVLGFNDELSALGSENERRVRALTVRNLLEHTGGGWGNSRRDPMFATDALELDHDGLIRWTLRNRRLEHDPGEHYSYSNFGYCLLGRVIERKTGRSYAQSVIRDVLGPCGIRESAMQIGGGTVAERLQNEVSYFGQDENAYAASMNVRRMDSHGGWVASPTDLVRFAVHVDGFSQPQDVLSDPSIAEMATPSRVGQGYAKGWMVNKQNNWWHTGSFNGGSSILARIHDQHCWSMTVNTRSRTKEYRRDLDQLLWKIKRCVHTWGKHDLFVA